MPARFASAAWAAGPRKMARRTSPCGKPTPKPGSAFHCCRCGNWAIDVRTRSVVNSPAWVVLTLGTAEEDLRLELPPGGSFEMPEILIQALPQGQPHLAAPALHQIRAGSLRLHRAARTAGGLQHLVRPVRGAEAAAAAPAAAGGQAAGLRGLRGRRRLVRSAGRRLVVPGRRLARAAVGRVWRPHAGVCGRGPRGRARLRVVDGAGAFWARAFPSARNTPSGSFPAMPPSPASI